MAINPDNYNFECIEQSGYVDKTGAIACLNPLIKGEKRFLCIARPRRFGKSVALKTLMAYYSKGCDSKELFSKYEIAHDPSFEKHLNKHNVIFWDMSSYVSPIAKEGEFFRKFNRSALRELKATFKDVLEGESYEDITEALELIKLKTKERFIFLIDEWDSPLRELKNETEKKGYINLLRTLFKAELSSIVSLAYLTGIFPIGRYDTESALNNFQDINMLTPQWPITQYFGFNESDVKKLCFEHNLNFESAKLWYDGYHLGNKDIYNPYSISQLILERLYTSYWIRTGSFEQVLKVINQNVDGIRDLILSLMSGNKYQNIDTTKFKNPIVEIKDKNAALIYLVHLGYLTFKQNDDGTNEISIPNEEVRQVFVSNIDTDDSIFTGLEDYFDLTYKASNALLNEDANELSNAIDAVHNQKISYKDYNNEVALRYAVKDTLFGLQKYYLPPFDELPSGKGIADVVYIPKPQFGHNKPYIIIELKWDKSASDAMQQIIDKGYAEKFLNEKRKVLLVGINYDSKTKEHQVEIKKLN